MDVEINKLLKLNNNTYDDNILNFIDNSKLIKNNNKAIIKR